MILSGKSHSLNEFQTHSIDLTTYKESTKFIWKYYNLYAISKYYSNVIIRNEPFRQVRYLEIVSKIIFIQNSIQLNWIKKKNHMQPIEICRMYCKYLQ